MSKFNLTRFTKFLCIFSLLLNFENPILAQDYKPFYMDNAEWVMERIYPGMGGRNTYEYWKVYTLNDTIIGGNTYRIIATKNLCQKRSNLGEQTFNPSIDTSQYLLGGIREEDKKIFFF